MYKIAVATTTRAEYGLLYPFLKRIVDDSEVELDLLVSGTHLSEKYGNTVDEIIHDNIPISHRIPILENDDTPFAVSKMMANALIGFADCISKDRPDVLVVSCDRTEMLAIACAAMNERIPLVHYSGGEVTEGAVDDCVRHALTKLSYLHFTTTEEYRRRVISLGESPDRVFNVGALAMENIAKVPLFSESEIKKQVGIPTDRNYVVVTFHPVTLEENSAYEQANILCSVMKERSDYNYIITKANADAGGNEVNKVFEEFVSKNSNSVLVDSLGMKRYLSAVKHSAFVMGNSSSGLTEAPMLGVPTINIGDRQRGRLAPKTVVHCKNEKDDILHAILKAESMEHVKTDIYGDGNASEKMLYEIKQFLKKDKFDLKKGFYEKES